MASPKRPASETPRTGVVHNVDLPFVIEDTPVPASAGRFGSREPSAVVRMFGALKPNQSFFMPAENAPDEITDPVEHDKVRQENAKKLRMGVMNSARHFLKKAENSALKFSAVVQKSEGGALGVRVGRTA